MSNVFLQLFFLELANCCELLLNLSVLPHDTHTHSCLLLSDIPTLILCMRSGTTLTVCYSSCDGNTSGKVLKCIATLEKQDATNTPDATPGARNSRK